MTVPGDPSGPPHGNPGCPDDCPDKEKHQQYANRMAEWQARLRIDRASTAGNPDWSRAHQMANLQAVGASHEKTCPLLYGCRSMSQELATGLGQLLNVPPAELLSKFKVVCQSSSRLEVFTLVANPGARDPLRITLSHGLQFFILNCNMIAGAFFDFGDPTRKSPISLDRGRSLLLDQLYFFWAQGDKNDLLFPHYEFDLDTYRDATETTMLTSAFLIAHEIAHIVHDHHPQIAWVVELRKLASAYLEHGFPPPFLNIVPKENWKDLWIEEFVCDALAALALFACGDKSRAAAFPDAPKISDLSRAWRQHAMESLNLYMDALYLRNLLKPNDQGEMGTDVLYSGSHPMPHLRRTFIRHIATKFSNPKLTLQTDRFESTFKTLFDRDEWVTGRGGGSERVSSQKEAETTVPGFIARYEQALGHFNLELVASLGMEAQNLKQRFAGTSYAPKLDAIVKHLEKEMVKLGSAPMLEKLLEVAVGGQYSRALQGLSLMEKSFVQLGNPEASKNIIEELRKGLRQSAMDFAKLKISQARRFIQDKNPSGARKLLLEAKPGLQGMDEALQEIDQTLTEMS